MFLSWPEEDQDKALAFMRDQRDTCNGCGTRPDEWEADSDAYLGDFWVCPGCQRLEEEHDNVPEGMKGVHYRLLPRKVALAKIEAELKEQQERKERRRGGDS